MADLEVCLLLAIWTPSMPGCHAGGHLADTILGPLQPDVTR